MVPHIQACLRHYHCSSACERLAAARHVHHDAGARHLHFIP